VPHSSLKPFNLTSGGRRPDSGGTIRTYLSTDDGPGRDVARAERLIHWRCDSVCLEKQIVKS